jgi:ribosome-associated toxin RatA of RatAB toxin-antitoxin module
MSSSTRLTVSRRVAASIEDAYRIVIEIEQFPEFMDNVESVEILSTEGARKTIAWTMIIDDAPLDWTEEVSYDDKQFRVDFRAIDGIFERFDGYWQVFPEATGSRIDLDLEYELGLPEIAHIISPILKDRLLVNLEAMLTAIQNRATVQ